MVEVDIHSHRQFAAMTALLVAVLIALYLHVLVLGNEAGAFLRSYGPTPSKLLPLLQWRQPYRALYGVQLILMGLFLHASWLHLLINVFFLLLFGASVEDRLSHYRFLQIFLVCGAVSVLAQALMMPDSHVTLVGAQGGVAGIGGACLTISPRGQVPTMIRGFAFPWVFGPVAWLLAQTLVAAIPLALPLDVDGVALPYLLLAYAAGAVLGPLSLRQRPILLRG